MTATTTDMPIPRVEEHPRHLAATATMNRLAAEVARLERELSAQQAIAEEARQADRDVARRLVGGATLAQVRSRPVDSITTRLRTDLANARRGHELAAKELHLVAQEVARELAEAYAPTFRARVRPAAVKYLEFARVMHAHRLMLDELREAGLLTGPCSNPMPRFVAAGDPSSLESQCSYTLRSLIDAGVLSERDDAELLRGLAIQPRFEPTPAPAPPAPKRQITFKGALASIGIEM